MTKSDGLDRKFERIDCFLIDGERDWSDGHWTSTMIESMCELTEWDEDDDDELEYTFSMIVDLGTGRVAAAWKPGFGWSVVG